MIWFPVPDGITTLPAAPSPTVNNTPNAVDTIPAPVGFDPDNVDIDDLFDNIVQTNVAPLYPQELDLAPLIQPVNEIVQVDAVTTCAFTILEAEYSLAPIVEPVTLTVKCVGKSVYFVTASTGTYSVQGNAAQFVYTRDPISRQGNFNLNGQQATFNVNPDKLQAENASYNIGTIRRIAIHAGEGSLLDSLEENNAEAIGNGFAISYSIYKFGSGSIENTNTAIVHLTRRTSSSTIRSGQDFTTSFWYRTNSVSSSFAPVFSFSSEYVIAQYQSVLTFGRLSPGTGVNQVANNIIYTPIVISSATLSTNTFIHVALEVYNGQVRLYVNGQATSAVTAPSLQFNSVNGFTLFGVPVYNQDGSVTRNNAFYSGTQYFDDIVIDNGARYLGNSFAVPTAPLAELIAVNFIYKKTLTAAAGNYSLVGQTSEYRLVNAKIIGASGSFSVAGQTATWRRPTALMQAAATSVTLTGQATLEGPTFVAGSIVTGSYENGSATSRLLDLPSNLAIDDIIILVAETSGEVPTYPTLSGWNLINNAPLVTSANSSGCQLYVWWRRVSSLVQPDVYLPVVDHIAYGTFLLRGTESDGSPIEVFAAATSTSNSTVVAPSVTTINPLTRVVIISGHPEETSSTSLYGTVTNAKLKGLAEHFEYSTSQGNGGGFVVASGAFLKSGVVGTTTINKAFTSVNATYVLAFKAKAIAAIPTAYVFAGETGAYILTGRTAILEPRVNLEANTGSTTLAGQTANFVYNRGVAAAAGAVSWIGRAAGLVVNRMLSSAAGSLALTGQNANFTSGTIISAAKGTFNFSGQDALWAVARALPGAAGTLTLNGQTSNLLTVRRLNSDPSTYTLTGQNSDLIKIQKLVGEARAFTLAGQAASFIPAPPTDPYFSDVSLLLHFNGANNSTTITDSSSKNLTATAYNSAVISTGASKFGGSSLYMTRNYLDGVDVQASTHLNFGTGDFTFEYWYLFVSRENFNYCRVFGHTTTAETSGTFRIRMAADTSGGNVIGEHILCAANSGSSRVVGTRQSVIDGAWHHIAFCRSGTTLRCFRDGVLKETVTNSTDYSYGSTGGLRIGSRGVGVNDFSNVYIDDVRVTKGVARYTAAFTPPTTQFPDS